MTHNKINAIESTTYNTYNGYYTNNIHAIFTTIIVNGGLKYQGQNNPLVCFLVEGFNLIYFA